MKIMMALRVRIPLGITTFGDKHQQEVVYRNCVTDLQAIVSKAKKDHGVDAWAGTAQNTLEFQQYLFVADCEAFAYYKKGFVYASDDGNENNVNIGIRYLEKARGIYNSIGYTSEANAVTTFIEHAKNVFSGKFSFGLLGKTIKERYENLLREHGETSEQSVIVGIGFSSHLKRENHSIEAERLVTKLTAICLRVYGEEHKFTKQCIELLNDCKRRLVMVMDPESDSKSVQIYEALTYENDGETLVVAGPIFHPSEKCDKDGQKLTFESKLIIPLAGCCPVICHGLINAQHLNGKLGDVRSSDPDGSGELRCAVHFEDKALKPASVKPINLRVVFDLPKNNST